VKRSLKTTVGAGAVATDEAVPALASMHPSAARWIGALIRMSSPHPAMGQILDVVERLQDRPYRTSCLLLGEPGTGKEGLARALHHLMAPGTPLVRVDFGGYSDEEALAGLSSLAKEADGGMLLVEEIALLSARVQTALLRLLKGDAVSPRARDHIHGVPQKETQRRLRLNVVALSDRSLAADVAGGRFRHDLYFALARIVLTLPPLRERPQDLGPACVWIGNRILRAAGRDRELMTAEEFARATAAERGSAIELRPDAVAALARHDWPGNFRELETVLERAVMLHRNGASIGAQEVEAALATPP
jgi:DNA-binding NtrC family response regulator